MVGAPPDPEPADIPARPVVLDFDAQRMRSSLREKMFGIAVGPMRIDRFGVIGLVGRGGTGIVYAAHDAKLDRKVAIKVLAGASEADSALHERIVREAQVLATLSHPNVIQIYEVGRLDDRVFLAMEFVDGTTIGEWQASPRSWREIVDKYRQAGSGLAAAHREGIVHRDVKPANLLLGRDGRVRVVDFGLARPLQIEPESDSDAPPSHAPGELELTQTNDLMGTPAYMAPEQVARRDADPRSDQFSFCVALYEALFGVRPHAGRTSAEVLLAIVEGGRAAVPRGTRVPNRIRRAVERGLAQRPEDRFPDMDALLVELQPSRARAGLVLPGVAAVALAMGATWIVATPSPCEDPSLDGTWDDARRDAIADAFARTQLPAAGDADEAVRDALDRYANAWTEVRSRACTDDDLLDRRIACLDRRRDALDALARRLVDADAEVVHHALEAASALPRIDACEDEGALRSSVPPPDPSVRSEVAAVRVLVDEARAQSTLGHYRDGAQQAALAVERARSIGYAPVLAEALLTLGRADAQLDRTEQARTSLRESAELAESSRHDEVAADAWIELVYVSGGLLYDRDAALAAARQADAAVSRLGDDPIRRAELLRDLGLTHFFAEDPPKARAAYEEALRLQRRELGDDDLEVARTLGNYADALAWAGQVEQALPHFEEAHETFAARVGPRHPRVGMTAFVHGLALQSIGRHDEARARFDAALEVYLGAFGPQSAKVAAAYEAIAKLELERQRFAEGLEPARAALEIRTAIPSEREDDRFAALVLLGELEHANDRPQAAIEPYREALALTDDAAQRVLLQTNLALALLEAGRAAEAVPAFEQALASFAAPDLADHPVRSRAVVGLADALVEIGRPQPAAALVERMRAELTDATELAQWIEQHPQLVR